MNGEGVTIPEDLDRLAWQKMDQTFPDHPGIFYEDLTKIFTIFGTFNMKPESKYRIWSFEGYYGRAEPVRLLLTHAGV